MEEAAEPIIAAGETAALPELRETPRGLALIGDGMEVRGDFSQMARRIRPSALAGELLVRAAKVKGAPHPVALDATAGLGEDSFLLAAAGFTVRMYEANPVIAALVRDALARAQADPAIAEIAQRMTLFEEDSIAAMRAMAPREHKGGAPVGSGRAARAQAQPAEGAEREAADATRAPAIDVIYLDPMFPARRKSAAVKKKFQLIHHLERPCSSEEELLFAAIAARPRKVVVKRPAKGPYLAGVKPSYSIAGKAVRYDCITPASVKL